MQSKSDLNDQFLFLTINHTVAALFAKPLEIGAQGIGKKRNVARMDDQIRACFDPSQLILDAPRIMHAHADLSRPGFGDDRSDGFFEPRMGVLFGRAEAAREVVRADQQSVNIGYGENFVETVEGWGAFDIEEQYVFGATLGDILAERRFKLALPIQHLFQHLSFERSQLDRATQPPRLFGRFDVWREDAARAIVERDRGLIWVGRGDANQRRKAEGATGLAHPCQRRAINGDVFRIDEDEIRAGAFYGGGPVR